MKSLVYGSLLMAAFQVATLQALECSNGVVCIHDNDGTEVCAEETSTGINCPAGTTVVPGLGVLVPTCNSGNVACIHQNDGTAFCYPGYICPAGSTQVGPIELPACSNNQQMCVYGSMYGCFDWACPSGMTPVGTIDCTIPPKTCASSEKLCIYDIGNAFACQSSGYDCWPGTHEWLACPKLDFTNGFILLARGHFIKCFNGLTKNAVTGIVTCSQPMFDMLSWPLNYLDSKLLFIKNCYNADNTLKYLLPVAQDLQFSSVTGQWNSNGYSKLPQSWVNQLYSYSPAGPTFPYPEYCYTTDGEVLHFTDPRCEQYPSNGNCYANEFSFLP